MNVMVASDMDAADNENGRNESEENLTQCSGFYISMPYWLKLFEL